MTDPFIAKLDGISAPGTSATQFLKQLGPIHFQWHFANNNGTDTIGFLLFHWELIQRFQRVGGPAHFGGVTPFTAQELNTFHAAYSVSTVVQQGNVTSLEDFSSELEGWHNDAHMAIGMHFHKNLMNPKSNVRLVQFWQLHYFINDRFEDKLRDFRASAQASIPSVVAQLEAGPAVARI